MRKTKSALLGVTAASFLLVLAGCSSSDDTAASESASPIASPTTAAPVTPTQSSSPTSSPTSSLCSESAILDAIPEGSEMVRYDCAEVGDELWAATEVKPGPTVFFLKANNDQWDVMTEDEVCGTASAGLPDSILDYCTT